ncbi:MAG: RES domain-containing protein [Magnetococcales bacterium]|nr:RES domain-containing protein [Magnetococcales bacterium]
MNESTICAACIKDAFLQQRVINEGSIQPCSACGSENQKSIPITDLLEQIATAFKLHHGIGDYNQYLGEAEGDDLQTMLYEFAGWDDPVNELIAQALFGDEPGCDPRDGDSPFFSDDFTYIQLNSPYYQQWRGPIDSWHEFKQHIKHEARFFSKTSTEQLHRVFDDLEIVHKWINASIIRTIGPGTEIDSVFRAREVDFRNEKAIVDLLRDPANQLGAPPARVARANRLNPAGIVAFYGSMDTMTCLAELRLPTGSSVIIGRFTITRPLRILDLMNLSHTIKSLSPFDPEFQKAQEFSTFLNHFALEISRPILPSNTDLEYIATQAVAEYLAHHHSPRFDGILYNSAQERDGGNLVLFHHACTVDDSGSLEGQDFSFYPDVDHDDDGPGILIGYNLFYKSVPPSEKGQQASDFDFLGIDIETKKQCFSPALTYIEKSAKVYHVEGVKYSSSNLPITYYGKT